MKYFMPLVYQIFWVSLFVFLLLIPDSAIGIATMAVLLLIFNQGTLLVIMNTKEPNESHLIEIPAIVVKDIICIVFIIYALSIKFKIFG